MKNRWRHVCLSVVFLAPSLSGPIALAAAFHDEAMAIVHKGESLSDTGNSDAAMAEYARVEELYPEESEAVAWARYRLSEIYEGGMLWSEAAMAAKGAREKVQADPSVSADLRFLASYQLARCLDKLWIPSVLPQIVEEALANYGDLPAPSRDLEVASGWLLFFKTKYKLGEGDFAAARQAAHSAVQVAKKASNGQMLAWSKLFEARALIGQGNLILAESILEECLSEHAGAVEKDYAADTKIRLIEVQTGLGRLDQAHDAAVSLFLTVGIAECLQAEGLVRFAEAAIAQGAKPEAVRALALAKNAFGNVPTWGDTARARWYSLVNKKNAAGLLQDAASAGSAPERAAVALELARRESEAAAGIAGCDTAESLCSDPRLKREIDLVRDARSGQDAMTVRDKVLANANGDRRLIERVLESVRPKPREGVPGNGYLVWLDAHQADLPEVVYLLEKAFWIRDASQDYEAALPLFEEVLSGPVSQADRAEALQGKMVCLYRLERDEEAEATVALLGRDVLDPAVRERALLIAGDRIDRYREQPALDLFDRVIASGQDPVWLREAYLLKAHCLWNYHRGDAAVKVLEELASLGPLESGGGRLVGQGLLLQAAILYPHRRQPERAERVYEFLVSSPGEFPAVQQDAYVKYVSMLEKRNSDPGRIIEVCNRGLDVLHRPLPRTWGLLTLSREKARYKSGHTDNAITAIKELRRKNPNGEIGTLATRFLKEVGE